MVIIGRKITVQSKASWVKKHETLIWKITVAQGMAQAVKIFLSKHKVLSSIPCTTKKIKKNLKIVEAKHTSNQLLIADNIKGFLEIRI
jgi:hypothetical protein